MRKKRKNIPFSVRKFIYDKHKGVCVICKKDVSLFKAIRHGETSSAIDHIHPVSKGGGNEIENLQLLCIYCNSKKFDSVTYMESYK